MNYIKKVRGNRTFELGITQKGHKLIFVTFLAVWTGLEPATPCVTGMYSNQLNYQTKIIFNISQNDERTISFSLRSGRDSNPRPHAWQACILTSWTTRPFCLNLTLTQSTFLIVRILSLVSFQTQTLHLRRCANIGLFCVKTNFFFKKLVCRTILHLLCILCEL